MLFDSTNVVKINDEPTSINIFFVWISVHHDANKYLHIIWPHQQLEFDLFFSPRSFLCYQNSKLPERQPNSSTKCWKNQRVAYQMVDCTIFKHRVRADGFAGYFLWTKLDLIDFWVIIRQLRPIPTTRSHTNLGFGAFCWIVQVCKSY